MKLTDTACKAAKPRKTPYKLADGFGMYLEVMPHGSKLWRLKFRTHGKESRLSLGNYPETTLSEARDKRAEARKLLAAGISPALNRQQGKQTAALDAQNTFEAVAREWHDTHRTRWSDGYADSLMHRLEADIFPPMGKLPVKAVTAPQLLAVLKGVQKRGAIEMAHRLMQTCSQVFRYAIATSRAERDTAADLKGALKPKVQGHYAALEATDIPAFLQALDSNDARLYAPTRHAIRLMMLTFVRTSELIQAKWDEFDFKAKQWNIPAERMKMRRPHVVPLSAQAIEVLEAQKP